MREILFRGKRTDNGEWVEGFYTLYANSRGLHPCILTGTEQGCVIPAFVIPETVGQYTGLTDENGKKIFEGDICLCDRNINDHIDKKTYIVKFESLRGWYGESKDGWSEFDGSAWECAEVIGNIYDNPELLG